MARDKAGTANAARQGDQEIADAALLHLLGDPDLVGAFTGTSGMSVADLRAAAGLPELAAQSLEFICEDDQRLIAFAARAGVTPEHVARARLRLAGPGSHGWDAD